jgi:hypothetical protein
MFQRSKGGEKMQKILKIKVGDVFIDGKNYPVFQTAWKKESKDKKTTYYEIREPIFIQEVAEKAQLTGDI